MTGRKEHILQHTKTKKKMKQYLTRHIGKIASFLLVTTMASSCQKNMEEPVYNAPERETEMASAGGNAILIAIDQSSIANDLEPNYFTSTDVNDNIATVGLRATLPYFQRNIGKVINLYTGEVGDEGWFALKTIPTSWKRTGPSLLGSQNYLNAGAGLGSGINPESLLDKIPNVTPLRARGLSMLTGQTVLAVVYDGDVSINYDTPINGSLKGANFGLVALKVQKVTRRTNGSTGSLPTVQVLIEDVNTAKSTSLQLFSNAPRPSTSSLPFDVRPPSTIPVIKLVTAQ